MTHLFKHIIATSLLLGICLFANAQNQQGKGLVDRQVTLDDKNADKQNANADKRAKTNADKRANANPQTGANAKPHGATDSEALATPKPPASHNGTSIRAFLDTNAITIGEQTLLHIVVTAPGNNALQLPTLQQLQLAPTETLDITNDTSFANDGTIESIEMKAVVTSFEPGTHSLDGIAVALSDGKEVALIAPADSLTLTVNYVADADTAKCATKADSTIEKEPYTFWEIARWPLLALAVAALVAAIVWIIRRRKEHKPILALPGTKPVPADRKALAELQSLKRKELWQKGRVKKYYTDLTDIVRRFLHNMYGIAAAEMTSKQTLAAFHKVADRSDESESLLRMLLQQADMVKFAKSQPFDYEHDQAMNYAVDFVKKVAETHSLNNPETKEEK